MIDSITIRVHRCGDVHAHVLTKLLELQNGWSIKRGKVNIEEILDVPEDLRFDYMENTAKGDLHPIIYKTPLYISSSHYNLACFVNPDQKTVEFNFSIPKYLFGANVLQFVTNPTHPIFQFGKHSTWDHQITDSYSRFASFLRMFFTDHFGDYKNIDFNFVELARIDFCFNQVFQDPRHVVDYLKAQRLKRAKNVGRGGDYSTRYDGTVMWKTKAYSKKIYWKGPEFRRNDSKELLKRGVSVDRVKELQHLADRTLRYEMTIRPAFMSQVFNQYVFRKNCPTHRARYKLFREIDNQYRSFQNDKAMKPTAPEMKFHAGFSKLLTKRKKFFFKVPRQIESLNRNEAVGQPFNVPNFAKYSAAFHLRLLQQFKQFFDDFQLDKMPTFLDVKKKMDAENAIRKKYNTRLKNQFENHLLTERDYRKARRRIIPKGFLAFIHLWLQSPKDDDILTSGVIHERSLYRYKIDLADLGYSENSILEEEITPPQDFRQYYSELLHTYKYLT